MAETRFEGGTSLRTVAKNGYFGQRFFATHGITHPIDHIEMRISKSTTATSTIGVGIWLGYGATATLWEQVDLNVVSGTGRQWVSANLTNPLPPSEIADKLFEIRLYHRDTTGTATPNYSGEYNASATYPNSMHIYGSGTTHSVLSGAGTNFILSGTVITPSGPAVKRWDGSQWVTASVKRWNGSQWVTPTSFTRY